VNQSSAGSEGGGDGELKISTHQHGIGHSYVHLAGCGEWVHHLRAGTEFYAVLEPTAV